MRRREPPLVLVLCTECLTKLFSVFELFLTNRYRPVVVIFAWLFGKCGFLAFYSIYTYNLFGTRLFVLKLDRSVFFVFHERFFVMPQLQLRNSL